MKPQATLLIPLFNRPRNLQTILEYLGKQTLPSTCFEVVLVDDSGPENYQPQKEIANQSKTGFTLKYFVTNLPKEVNGVTIARNIGIRQASSPLIIFMDDDCFPHPSLIEEHIKAHNEIERLILIGYKAENIEALDQPLPIEIQTPRGVKESKKGRLGTLGAGNFSTSNASVKLIHLEEVNLFDESFAQPNEYGYEDREIGQRLIANDMIFRFSPRAVVYLLPKENKDLDRRDTLQMAEKSHRRFKKIQRKFKIAQMIKRVTKIFSRT